MAGASKAAHPRRPSPRRQSAIPQPPLSAKRSHRKTTLLKLTQQGRAPVLCWYASHPSLWHTARNPPARSDGQSSNAYHAIREYQPVDGSFVEHEGLFEQAFQTPDPTEYYDAIFNLFERFPEDDGAGVFWSALHSMEAIGNYESKLRQYWRRWPNLMNRIMMKRLSKDETESNV